MTTATTAASKPNTPAWLIFLVATVAGIGVVEMVRRTRAKVPLLLPVSSVVPVASSLAAPGYFGPLSQKVAAKVTSAINTSTDPAMLTQLSNGLAASGAQGAAAAAAAKAQQVSAATAPPGFFADAANVVQSVLTNPAVHSTIKQGSSGPEVAMWQAIIGVTADGQFGPATATATKKWQSAHGLAADGIVGPQTWSVASSKGVP